MAPGSEARGRGDCVIRQNARYPLNNEDSPRYMEEGWRGCGVFEGYGRLDCMGRAGWRGDVAQKRFIRIG